mgnify:FL=1
MKNKEKLKKFLIILSLYTIFIIFLTYSINKYEYQVYKDNFDTKITSIILKIKEDYPNITDEELYNILKSSKKDGKVLEQYSLTIDNKSLLKENDNKYQQFLVTNIMIVFISTIFLIFLFLRFNAKKDREINKITKCLEEINKRNYKIDIEEMSEDELSILKNELYKVTIKLKEDAENSKQAKKDLKDTLADISHQLKTPITSILIILDNIIDNPDMDKNTKEDFIRDIKRELLNMNFLALNLLKLSKLDSNTVHFLKKEVSLDEIVTSSIKNVSPLCDLKNITITKNLEPGIKINCDLNWQVEAITNILKNCVEHSKENSKIDITTSANKVYLSIKIRDYGTGISKKDLPHIFERFYKGTEGSTNSIGIGLSLAQKIIESNDGLINVETGPDGTTFTIKYLI